MSSVSRCILSSVEFVLFAINVVKEDKQTASISYYGGFSSATPRVLFACRVLPTLFFFAYYALLGDYFAGLYYTIRETNYSTLRRVYWTIGVALYVVLLCYFLALPDPTLLNIVCLAITVLLSVWITRHAFGINQFYVHNEDVLMDSSAIDQTRLLARMQRVVGVALCALASCAVEYSADLAHLLPRR